MIQRYIIMSCKVKYRRQVAVEPCHKDKEEYRVEERSLELTPRGSHRYEVLATSFFLILGILEGANPFPRRLT